MTPLVVPLVAPTMTYLHEVSNMIPIFVIALASHFLLISLPPLQCSEWIECLIVFGVLTVAITTVDSRSLWHLVMMTIYGLMLDVNHPYLRTCSTGILTLLIALGSSLIHFLLLMHKHRLTPAALTIKLVEDLLHILGVETYVVRMMNIPNVRVEDYVEMMRDETQL